MQEQPLALNQQLIVLKHVLVTYFTKSTAVCLTPYKAKDCLDQQGSMRFGQNMPFSLGSGVVG